MWIAITNDSSKFLTASYDNYVKIWDLYDDYSLIEILSDSTHDVEKVLISRDDTTIYSANYENEIIVYKISCDYP